MNVLKLCSLLALFVSPSLASEAQPIVLQLGTGLHDDGRYSLDQGRQLEAVDELFNAQPYTIDSESHFDFKTTALRQNHRRLLEEAVRRLQNTGRLPLIEVVLQIFILSNFEAFLSRGSVASEISGSGPFTVLMPYNPAWNDLDERVRDNLTDMNRLWDAHLKELLRGHFIDGDITVDSLGANQTLRTRNGQDVIFTRTLGTSRVRVNGFQSLAAYNATNGMAYMLADVILPPWYTRNLLELALSLSGELSELTSYVVTAGLESVFRNPNASLTVLAPYNAAFEGLPQATADFLKSDEGVPQLQEILSYHVVTQAVNQNSGLFPEFWFTRGARELTTAQGGMLRFSLSSGNSPTIIGESNQATIIGADLPASNGLIHVIDTILLPPSDPIPTVEPNPLPTMSPVVIPTPPSKPSEWERNGDPLSSPTLIELGSSASVAGNYAIVGAPANPTNASNDNRAGGVLVFEKGVAGNWTYIEQVSNTVFREFGASIDISRDPSGGYGFVVGAPLSSGGGIVRGAVLYYQRVEGRWQQIGGTLRPPAVIPSAFSNYGASVATSTGPLPRVVIGAPDYDLVDSSGGATANNGRVFTYRIENPSTGFLLFGQDLYGDSPGDRFGAAVDISTSGEPIVVGAPGTAGQSSGKVYIYEEDTPFEWSESFMMLGPDSTSNFGATVAFVGEDDGIVAVGAPNFGDNQGMICLFERTSEGWQRFGADIVGQAGERLGSSFQGSEQFLVAGVRTGAFRGYEILPEGWAGLEVNIDDGAGLPPVTAIGVGENDVLIARQGETAPSQTVTFYKLLNIPPPAPTNAPTESMAPTPIIPTISPITLEGRWNSVVTISGNNVLYGRSMSTAGDFLVVGAPGVDAGPGFQDVGFIYTYQRGGFFGWTELINFADTSLRSFGSAVDLSFSAVEDRYGLVLGAPSTATTSGNIVGAAQYRELAQGPQSLIWRTVGSTLRPPNTPEAVNSAFGTAVAVAARPRRVVVGAPLHDDDGDIDCGLVFTYDYVEPSFRVIGIGTVFRGVSPGARFGSSVDMTTNGLRLVVGAPGSTGASPGAFFVYSFDGDGWSQMFTATGPDSTSNLGTTVVFLDNGGNTVAVGAPNYNGGRGLVRVYQRNLSQGTWSQLGNEFVGSAGEFLGRTLSGSLGLFVIGTSDGNLRSYRFSSNAWEAITDELTFSPIAPVDSIAVNGLTVFAGRTQNGDRVGILEVV